MSNDQLTRGSRVKVVREDRQFRHNLGRTGTVVSICSDRHYPGSSPIVSVTLDKTDKYPRNGRFYSATDLEPIE